MHSLVWGMITKMLNVQCRELSTCTWACMQGHPTRPSSQLLLYLSKSSLPANPPQQLPQPANQDHSFECLKASDMAAEDVMDFF